MGMTSVRMPDDLLDQLEVTAERLRRSKGWIINDAVREYLEREQRRQQRLAETQEALDDLDARVSDARAVGRVRTEPFRLSLGRLAPVGPTLRPVGVLLVRVGTTEAAKSAEDAARLWQVSEEATGVRFVHSVQAATSS